MNIDNKVFAYLALALLIMSPTLALIFGSTSLGIILNMISATVYPSILLAIYFELTQRNKTIERKLQQIEAR